MAQPSDGETALWGRRLISQRALPFTLPGHEITDFVVITV